MGGCHFCKVTLCIQLLEVLLVGDYFKCSCNGVEFRHPVAFRKAILCIPSILLKFDSLVDTHNANAYSSRCGQIKTLQRFGLNTFPCI